MTIIPGCVSISREWLVDSQATEDQLRAEVEKDLRCQLTFSKGWPGRATQDHKMARYGDEGVTYSYKDKKKSVHRMTPKMDELRWRIADSLKWYPNCCVVNLYTPAGDLYPHTDSKYIPELGENPTIVSLSFGATRNFLLFPLDKKGKPVKSEVISIPLGRGDMLIMYGECDLKYAHGIQPEDVEGLRLSLTFRNHHV